MKQLLLPLLLTGLFIAGCSSTPTHVDKGALKAHTFNFINGGIALTPPATDKRDAVHQQIQAAIIKNLAAKGLNRTDTTGDVIVAYLIILGNNVSTAAITTPATPCPTTINPALRTADGAVGVTASA